MDQSNKSIRGAFLRHFFNQRHVRQQIIIINEMRLMHID